jgi:3-deoxy-D-manno-octulosonate 8-phosphate phosphatase (KDO 8-P phosphatase)
MALIQTLYGEIQANLLQRFAQVKLLVCDVDGVFSDGRIYMGNEGEELKAFHTKDGYGVKALLGEGIQFAIITGRQSKIVENRMTALGVKYIIQGQEDKQSAVQELQRKLGINKSFTASMGDDMPDIGMFNESGLAISPLDGHPYVRKQAGYVTQTAGGYGAVREVCDLILQGRRKLDTIHGSSE